MKIHILLVGGGTGGHMYPLVAVAKKIQEKSAQKQIELDLRYFGDPGNYVKLLTDAGIQIEEIVSSKLRRYASVLNFLDFFRFFIGFFQAMVKLYFFMPEVVFSKSGPGVLPIIYAARWYRIPIIIHESDAVPGLTNQASARHARIVELAFENARQYFVANKVVNVVGNPVRDSLIAVKPAGACRQEMNLTDEKPIILIVGGSQGAQALNEFIMNHAEMLLNRFEIVHQIGTVNFEQYKKEFDFTTKHFNESLLKNYHPFPFLDDNQMACMLSAADVIISRAGSSIFEIAASGRPSILVPLSTAANNHQFENAYAYSKAGACIVIEENNLLSGLVMTQLEKILDNKDFNEKMGAAAKAFYKAGAADLIAKDVLSVVGA